MENLDKIQSDILSKIKNVSDKNSMKQLKQKFLVKKELLLNFLKK